MTSALHALAHQALLQPEAGQKTAIIAAMADLLESHPQDRFDADEPVLEIAHPGMPSRIKLVDPRDVGNRKLSSKAGRACFLHAVAHIEFNAINLALDAVYRFRALPRDYYLDWVNVAADEARHHQLVVGRMRQLGFEYGDFPAHNGLWDIARRTADSLLTRMALVPCVLEARGLDVTPAMISRLRAASEQEGATILQLILDEEVAHVAIGVRWFRYACREQNVEPVATYIGLLQQKMPGRRQGPLNKPQRMQAGFTREWLDAIEAIT